MSKNHQLSAKLNGRDVTVIGGAGHGHNGCKVKVQDAGGNGSVQTVSIGNLKFENPEDTNRACHLAGTSLEKMKKRDMKWLATAMNAGAGAGS